MVTLALKSTLGRIRVFEQMGDDVTNDLSFVRNGRCNISRIVLVPIPDAVDTYSKTVAEA